MKAILLNLGKWTTDSVISYQLSVISYQLSVISYQSSVRYLIAFKELSKILLKLSEKDLEIAIKNGDFKEVK